MPQSAALRRLFGLLLLATTLSSAHADSSLSFGNDFFVPGHLDRWATSSLSAVIKADDNLWLTLGQEMYTPTDKRSPEVPDGDRPWDGYSYIGARKRHLGETGSYYLAEVRLGAVGSASRADRLQKFVHNDLDMGTNPKGWGTQNPSEIAIDASLAHHFPNTTNTLIGETRTQLGYKVRLGNVITRASFLSEIEKGWRDFYFIAGTAAHAVLYNTHLDGRLLQNNTYTVDKKWFVAEASLGIGVRIFRRFSLEYKYKYTTEEFKGQTGRHSVGEVNFIFR
jgi:lipid A 3-O-deacylase